jgi:hypothetical protein
MLITTGAADLRSCAGVGKSLQKLAFVESELVPRGSKTGTLPTGAN